MQNATNGNGKHQQQLAFLSQSKTGAGGVRTSRGSFAAPKDTEGAIADTIARGTITTTLQSVASGIAQLPVAGAQKSSSRAITKGFQQRVTAQKGHIPGRSSGINQLQNVSLPSGGTRGR